MGKNMAIQNQRVKYSDNIVVGEDIVTGEQIKNAAKGSGLKIVSILLSDADYTEFENSNFDGVIEKDNTSIGCTVDELINADAIKIAKSSDTSKFYIAYLDKSYNDSDDAYNRYYSSTVAEGDAWAPHFNKRLVINEYLEEGDNPIVYVSFWFEKTVRYFDIYLNQQETNDINHGADGGVTRQLTEPFLVDILRVHLYNGDVYCLYHVDTTSDGDYNVFRSVNIPATPGATSIFEAVWDWGSDTLKLMYSHSFFDWSSNNNEVNDTFLGYDGHGNFHTSLLPSSGKKFRFNASGSSYANVILIKFENGILHFDKQVVKNIDYNNCLAVVFNDTSDTWSSFSGQITNLLTGATYSNVTTPSTSDIMQKIMLLKTDVTITKS